MLFPICDFCAIYTSYLCVRRSDKLLSGYIFVVSFTKFIISIAENSSLNQLEIENPWPQVGAVTL